MAVSPRSTPASSAHPLARLLDPGLALPSARLSRVLPYRPARTAVSRAHRQVEIRRRPDGNPGSRFDRQRYPAVMDSGPVAAGRPDPALVRASAAAAACAFADTLDTGSAEHWQRFRVLTPHVEELLLHAAAHLAPRARRDLLTCMVLCVAAHIWSKAERRAEQLSLRAMSLADNLGCHDRDVYLRLRHVHALARREQGWLTEAAEDFGEILAMQASRQRRYCAHGHVAHPAAVGLDPRAPGHVGRCRGRTAGGDPSTGRPSAPARGRKP